MSLTPLPESRCPSEDRVVYGGRRWGWGGDRDQKEDELEERRRTRDTH